VQIKSQDSNKRGLRRITMEKIINLMFEARSLKMIPRSGYSFLGNGSESVAEHSFIITFVSYLLAKLQPDVDEKKLLLMSLLHDLPEARIGDINYVQKDYLNINEKKAVERLSEGLPFGDEIMELIDEFNACLTTESKLARDADQIAFLIDLKFLKDKGARKVARWIDVVQKRLKTEIAKELVARMMDSDSDSWWLENYID